MDDEYDVIRNYLEDKLIKLGNHEMKGLTSVAFPRENFNLQTIFNEEYFVIQTNEFKQIINKRLERTRRTNLELFGTGNANDIIEAFYLDERFLDLTFEKQYLQTEQFCLIIDRTNNFIPTKILRIDLFRKIEGSKKNKGEFDFTGGLFHTLKHFYYKNHPLTTGIKEKKEIDNIRDILMMATVGLFKSDLKTTKKDTVFTSQFSYKKYGKFKAVFFFEMSSQIYFLNTIHSI